MVLKTPFVSSTAGGMIPPAASLPVPALATASSVLRTTTGGTAADADSAITSTAASPAGRPKPRRASRPRSKPRARDKPHFHRPDRTPQLVRGLLVGPPLKVAQHNGFSVFLGQPRELLMERSGSVQLMPFLLAIGPRHAQADAVACRHRGSDRLVFSPPGCRDPRPRGDPRRDSKEPARHRPALPDRTRASCQHQKRSLEGILRVIKVVERTPADLKDHWPVPLHERLEGDFIAA